MMCVYCGQESQGKQDQYEQDICDFCDAFYDAHPTPPIPTPTATLVNLETTEIVVKPVEKRHG